jgi:hypothetical protein
MRPWGAVCATDLRLVFVLADFVADPVGTNSNLLIYVLDEFHGELFERRRVLQIAVNVDRQPGSPHVSFRPSGHPIVSVAAAS